MTDSRQQLPENAQETQSYFENETAEEKFWIRSSNLQEKYKYQYTLVTTDPQASTPEFWITIAGNADTTYRLIKNWDFKSKKTSEDKGSSDAPEDLEVIGPTEIELSGPETFFEIFSSGSLPVSFRQQDLYQMIQSATNKGENLELLEKIVKNNVFIRNLDTLQLLTLAIKAHIGQTEQAVFFYYLKYHPETFHSRRITRMIKILGTDGGKVSEFGIEMLFSALFENPSILYGLSGDALVALMESSDSQSKRVARVILTNPVLANKLSDITVYSGYTEREKCIRKLKSEQKYDGDSVLDEVELKEILFGDHLWREVLSVSAKKQFDFFINENKDNKETTTTSISNQNKERPVLQFQTSPIFDAAKYLYWEYFSRLSKFDTLFLLNEFKQEQYQIFHIKFAKYLIVSNPLSAYSLLKDLLLAYGDEEEKQKLQAITDLRKDALERLCAEVEEVVKIHEDEMIEKYSQHLKNKFIEYLKQPYTSNNLRDFKLQFSICTKENDFKKLLQEIEILLYEAERQIVFEGEAFTISEFDNLVLDDHIKINEIRLKIFEFDRDKLGEKKEDDKSHLDIYRFLLNKVKEFAGLKSDNKYAELQQYLNSKNIRISNLRDIKTYFMRLKGREEGIKDFSDLLARYLPDVNSLDYPEQNQLSARDHAHEELDDPERETELAEESHGQQYVAELAEQKNNSLVHSSSSSNIILQDEKQQPKIDYIEQLYSIEEKFKDKSLLNEYAKKRLGMLRFTLFVSYNEKTKEDLKVEKQKFITALTNLIETIPEKKDKIAAYEFWQKSPVVHTHREAGIYAIGSTKTKDAITAEIKKLRK